MDIPWLLLVTTLSLAPLIRHITIVNVTHQQIKGNIGWRHLPTTVAVDSDLDTIQHSFLGAPNLIITVFVETINAWVNMSKSPPHLIGGKIRVSLADHLHVGVQVHVHTNRPAAEIHSTS